MLHGHDMKKHLIQKPSNIEKKLTEEEYKRLEAAADNYIKGAFNGRK